MTLFSREKLSFQARDGTRLRGWLYLPEGSSRAPGVIMTHGFTAIIEQGLAPIAAALAEFGFATFVYDHRGYGKSGGKPIRETDPFQQMHDLRDAITFATLLPRVQENRIGVWGTSYSGGHALVVGAVDRRVKCVISVAPLVSGSETAKQLGGLANMDARLARFSSARKAEMAGKGTQYTRHTDVQESLEWFVASDSHGRWVNEVSVLSHDMVTEYEPGDYIHRIAPTPLLMIVADRDQRASTQLQLEAYSRAREPKQLVMISGGHYDVYTKKLDDVVRASCEWFTLHL